VLGGIIGLVGVGSHRPISGTRMSDWVGVCMPVVWVGNLLCELNSEVEGEYSFTSHQLIYGYIETDDDEIDRNPDFHFKDKGSFTSHTT